MFSRKKEKNAVMMPPAGGEHINAEQEQAIRHDDGARRPGIGQDVCDHQTAAVHD